MLEKIRGKRTIGSLIAWAVVKYLQHQGLMPDGYDSDSLAALIDEVLLAAAGIFLRLGVKNDAK